MTEAQYQAKLIKRLHKEFPGCVVIKNDPQRIQGIQDLLILHNDRWAMLEVKVSETARTRPNQPFYVDQFNKMSYASFIYPENEDGVFDELQLALSPSR